MNLYRDYIQTLPLADLVTMFQEGVGWERTGTLAEDALIRKTQLHVLKGDFVALHLDMVHREVWRELAVRGMSSRGFGL